jgi:hypothetical protein
VNDEVAALVEVVKPVQRAVLAKRIKLQNNGFLKMDYHFDSENKINCG